MTITIEESNNVDINAWRNGYKWSVNECLRLEREYDLLELSVPDMAILHKRTMNAIMFKLQAEGLDTFNNLYFKTYGQDYIDEQINKLNNLCSDDIDEEDSDEEDSDEEDSDDEYDEIDDDDIATNISDRTVIFEHVKRIHKHLTNLLEYFTPRNKSTKEVHSSNL